MTITELNAVDIDRQNVKLVKSMLAQLSELFLAGGHKLPTDLRLAHADRIDHLGQDLLVLSRRDPFHQNLQNPGTQTTVCNQGLIGRNRYFLARPFAFLSQSGFFHPQLAFTQRDNTVLTTLPTDIASHLAGLFGAGCLLSTQEEYCLDRSLSTLRRIEKC